MKHLEVLEGKVHSRSQCSSHFPQVAKGEIEDRLDIHCVPCTCNTLDVPRREPTLLVSVTPVVWKSEEVELVEGDHLGAVVLALAVPPDASP